MTDTHCDDYDHGELWDHWAQRISGTVPDAEAQERLAEALYMDLARVAMPVATEQRRELFSFHCAASSEFFADKNYRQCVVMLEQAELLSGKDLIWLRTACAAVRAELERRHVLPPGTPFR